MRYQVIFLVAILPFLSSYAHAEKLKGTAALKDLQPAGVKDKDQKNQAYDLSFEAQGKAYTCRTDSNKSIDATEFIVGTQLKYEIDGNKTKLESQEGHKVGCEIVRVAAAPAAQ